MIKRGVFFIIVLLISNSCFADKIKVNYTVIPMAKKISGSFEQSYYGFKNASGGFHNIIKEITKETEITPNFVNYNDYFSAIQNTTIYSPNTNPEIMIGATFSEDITRYVDYVSVPIYSDYLVLVMNKKSLSKNMNFSKSLQDDIKKLAGDFIKIKGINIPNVNIKNFTEYKTVNNAMEEVFINNKIFLCPKTLIDEYIDKNNGAEKLNLLTMIDYREIPIYYFLAINKKSRIFKEKFDEHHFVSDIIFEKLQSIIDKNEILKIIENK